MASAVMAGTEASFTGSNSPVAQLSAFRLTARGQVFAALLTVLFAVALLVVLRPPATMSVPAVSASGDRILSGVPGAVLVEQGLATAHLVGPGDTLWGLATGLAPTADPRPLVDEIRQLNGLSGSRLSTGQTLYLPVVPVDDGATLSGR